MRKFNCINGEMIEAEDGEYVKYSDVIAIDNLTADTLLIQLRGLQEQIETWYV